MVVSDYWWNKLGLIRIIEFEFGCGHFYGYFSCSSNIYIGGCRGGIFNIRKVFFKKELGTGGIGNGSCFPARAYFSLHLRKISA